jgi:hypothetical protein
MRTIYLNNETDGENAMTNRTTARITITAGIAAAVGAIFLSVPLANAETHLTQDTTSVSGGEHRTGTTAGLNGPNYCTWCYVTSGGEPPKTYGK